jgi:site-specific recombinase XerC
VVAVLKKRVRAPKRKRLPNVLSDAEARAIIGRVRSPVQKAGMLLMYACGLRITEAATLEVTAIDGVHGLVRVIGKGNKERPRRAAQSLEDASQHALALPEPPQERADQSRCAVADVPASGPSSRDHATRLTTFSAA